MNADDKLDNINFCILYYEYNKIATVIQVVSMNPNIKVPQTD